MPVVDLPNEAATAAFAARISALAARGDIIALKGDLGMSIITNTSVMGEFTARFPATLELAICAMIFALVIGLPAGVAAA